MEKHKRVRVRKTPGNPTKKILKASFHTLTARPPEKT